MLKYNGTNNIITADDIAVSSDLSQLGETVEDILKTQDLKISKLTSNVKWIAKYGGVGGGGSSSGGTTTTGKFTFTTTINYTKLDGTEGSLNLTLGSNADLILLVLPNTNVTITTFRTSILTLANDVYYTILSLNSDSTKVSDPLKYFTLELTKYSINIKNNLELYTLIITGELKYSFNISIYSKIVEAGTKIMSSGIAFENKDIVYDSILDNLKLYPALKNLIPEIYTVKIDSVSVNDVSIEISDDDDPETVSYSIGGAIKGKNYGIYVLTFKYDIYLGSYLKDSKEVSYQFIYKDKDKVFIYCYSKTDDLTIYQSNSITSPNVYSNRLILIYYTIYGKSTDNDKLYTISIDGNTISNLTADKEYSYAFDNKVESTLWYNLICYYNEDYSNYYLYLDTPALLTYIFLDSSTNTLYYGASGWNTDEADIKTKVPKLPSKSTGEKFWKFTTETSISFGSSNMAVYPISSGDSLINFVKGTTKGNESLSKISDMIFNVGIKYNDLSYQDYIFKIEDENGVALEFYRDALKYNSTSYDKWAIPNDGKFHLITIYMKKLLSYTVPTSSTGEDSLYNLNTKFTIYVDGIQEYKVDTFNTSFSINGNSKITCNSGSNEYNFFSIYNILPRLKSNNYVNVVKKYMYDFDILLVSNFAMVYTNEHNKDSYDDYTSTIKLEEEYSDDLFYDISLYNTLCSTYSESENSNWINYYNVQSGDTTYTYNKFLPIQAKQIADRLNHTKDNVIPMYKIKLLYNASHVTNGIHSMLSGTFDTLGENAALTSYPCTLLKYNYTSNAWEDMFSTMYEYKSSEESDVLNVNVQFYVKYLGSSTLLYSVKNFAISASSSTVDSAERSFSTYFNMNTDVFDYPETSFNLKADLVDSSSSTNNVVGNFVNSYMTSPFNNGSDVYLSCLSGYPILLFVDDVNANTTDSKDIFLGIYNVNLNRDSVNNLGYLKLPDLPNSTYTNTNKKTSLTIRRSDLEVTIPKEYYVAEILGNSCLYDFSQFNRGLLLQMYGDYHVISGGVPKEEYSTKFETIGNNLAQYVYNKIISYAFNDYEYDFTDNYVSYDNPTLSGATYYDMQGTIKTLKSGDLIVNSSVLSTQSPYKIATDGVVHVGNISKLFAPLYKDSSILTDSSGENYYIILDNSPSYDEEVNTELFDLKESLKYYMVCMAFAMVDSVLKNLNVKGVNGTWYPEFYDMDTGLALDNAGDNSDYKAFSDYIDSTGTIISDYVEEGTTKWFDTASSLLFIYAKYAYLMDSDKLQEALYATPYCYWAALRGLSSTYSSLPGYGKLLNAELFCDDYLNSYISNLVPPLIWNLNYQYKYFSESKNNKSDTEEKRFNGTMKYRRLEWLSNRLHYLDALFGIANTRNIGKTNIAICEAAHNSENSDVEICDSMFPNFTKGALNTYWSVTATGKPRTIISFQVKDTKYHLRIVDDTGNLTFTETLGTNDAVGFYGSKHLYSLNEFGQFLCMTGSNTITGDLIKTLKITSDKTKSSTVNLADIPSVKEIEIGSDSSVSKLNLESLNITLSGTSDDIKIINNLKVLNLMLSSLTIAYALITNLTFTNNEISTVTFNNCLFPANFTLTSDASTITLSACTFIGNFTLICSNLLLVTVNIKGGTADGAITISGSTIKTINVTDNICNTFKLSNIPNLNSFIYEDNITDNIILNNELYSGNYGESYLNSNILTITISNVKSNASTLYIGLSCGGFKNLNTLDITINSSSTAQSIELLRGGLAYSQLNSLPSIISKLAANSSYSFWNALILDSMCTSDLLSLVINFTNAFGYAKITHEQIVTILQSLKTIGNTVNLNGTFLHTSFTITDIYEDSNEIAEVMPSVSDTDNIFYYSEYMITINLAKKLYNHIFRNSISTYHNSEPTKIESTALNDFTIIMSSDLYQSYKFYTYDTENSELVIVNNILYLTEFAQTTYLDFDIVTYETTDDTKKIVFDFGTDEISNLVTYVGIHKRHGPIGSSGLIKNFLTLKNNCPKLTTVYSDFRYINKLTYTDKNLDYFIDLYSLLTTNNELDTKFYNLINNNGTSIDYTNFTINKYITYTNFVKLLLLLANSNYEILGGIFYNCIVINTTTSDVFNVYTDTDRIGLLQPFTLFYWTFTNCRFINNSSETIYAKLENAFSKTILETDEEGTITNITTKGSLTVLIGTFYLNYLIPFSQYNDSYLLGIKNNLVKKLQYCFYNCYYQYSAYSASAATFNGSGLYNIELPADKVTFPILPKDFLKMCSLESCITDYAFATNRTVENCSSVLKGYIPDSQNELNPNNIDLNYVFLNDLIFWYKQSNLITIDGKTYLKDSIDYNTDPENPQPIDGAEASSIIHYRIFPKWYMNTSGTNARFLVNIPFPLNNDSYKCYLFYKRYEEDSLSIGLYSTLPLPPNSNGSKNDYYTTLLNFGNSSTMCKPIYPTNVNSENLLIASSADNYAYIIPSTLSVLLKCSGEIIENLTSVKKLLINNYITYVNDTNGAIYRGYIFYCIGWNNINTLVLNSYINYYGR